MHLLLTRHLVPGRSLIVRQSYRDSRAPLILRVRTHWQQTLDLVGTVQGRRRDLDSAIPQRFPGRRT